MFKNLKPVTSSLRHSFTLIKNLRKRSLLKNKIKYFKRSSGKNNSGKITVRHKGAGVKKKYRILDFKRNTKLDGLVCSLEHDPYRSAFIMSVFDTVKKKFFYSLAPEGITVGDSIKTAEFVPSTAGNSAPLKNLPAGLLISNITLKETFGGQCARAAGTYGIIRGHSTDNFSFVELISGEIRLVPSKNYVLLGKISNDTHFLQQLGKAGKSRWKNIRPSVRGVAMNPIDHPNGGGEGKKSGKGKTPWGQPGKKGKLQKKTVAFILKKRYE